ncbi:MAG: DUF4363 family protein [Ruminococcus sp.]|nr:DUF4363 family protein [Ruminococcus sp.]
MKRITLCIGIFIAIIVVSIGSLFLLHKNNKELTEKIDEIIELYNNESDEVSDKVNDLEKYWDDYYIRISFVAQSSTLDDISYSVAKLLPLYEQDSDEFVSECESIKYWIKRVYDSQFPHFYSVF